MTDKRAQATVELSRRPDRRPREDAADSPPLGRRIFSPRNIASILLTLGPLVPGVPAGPWSGLERGLDEREWSERGAVRARLRGLLRLVPGAWPALEDAARKRRLQRRLRPHRWASHALCFGSDQDHVRSLVCKLRHRRPARGRLPRVSAKEGGGCFLRGHARYRARGAAPGSHGAGGDDGGGRAHSLPRVTPDRGRPGFSRRYYPLGRWGHRPPRDAALPVGFRTYPA